MSHKLPGDVVGVVGAGVMGCGVAQNLSQAGLKAVVIDHDPNALESASEAIRNALRFQAFTAEDKSILEPHESVLSRIEFTTDFAKLSNTFFVIENVAEKWDAKQEVYAELERTCSPQTIYAVNTSCFSITRVGGLTQRPEQIIGIHFMNPVPMKPTVEVIKGYRTSEETITTTEILLGRMGKEGIIVNDFPGFVSNRILMVTINEAIFVLMDQVATAKQVDDISKKCFNHKMGPLETADLIGLDTILYSIEVLHESYGDSKYRPCPLLKKMVDAGLLGRKSGQGFYKYT